MKKSIGILGGMGPLATADLFQKIVCNTKADRDSGHIRVFMDNNPAIPDRTAAILGKGPDPLPEMTSALQSLEKCGADCIVMPCNTAHYYLDALQAKTKIPFLSILAETAKACSLRFPGKRACLLGTAGTYATGIYTRPLQDQGVECLIPDEAGKATLMDAIYALKGGQDISGHKAALEGLLEALRAQGADYFILGCTELPLIAQLLELPGDFIDPTLELARGAVAYCGYELL